MQSVERFLGFSNRHYLDPQFELGKTFLNYEHFIQNTLLINNALQNSNRISEIKKEYNKAYKHQISIIESFKKDLIKHINFRDIFLNRKVWEEDKTSYDLNFDYIRRDWSKEKYCESEIQLILDELKSQLDRSDNDKKRALILGAGAGRFTTELDRQFKEVHAID